MPRKKTNPESLYEYLESLIQHSQNITDRLDRFRKERYFDSNQNDEFFSITSQSIRLSYEIRRVRELIELEVQEIEENYKWDIKKNRTFQYVNSILLIFPTIVIIILTYSFFNKQNDSQETELILTKDDSAKIAQPFLIEPNRKVDSLTQVLTTRQQQPITTFSPNLKFDFKPPVLSFDIDNKNEKNGEQAADKKDNYFNDLLTRINQINAEQDNLSKLFDVPFKTFDISNKSAYETLNLDSICSIGKFLTDEKEKLDNLKNVIDKGKLQTTDSSYLLALVNSMIKRNSQLNNKEPINTIIVAIRNKSQRRIYIDSTILSNFQVSRDASLKGASANYPDRQENGEMIYLMSSTYCNAPFKGSNILISYKFSKFNFLKPIVLSIDLKK